VAETIKFRLPQGEWYLHVEGDLYNLLSGRVFDSTDNSHLRLLGMTPEWETCEVRHLQTFFRQGERERETGPGRLTRQVERPLPSNSPHDHMILRGDLVDSHGRWKRHDRRCRQSA
jgi:hypothetical protein